METGEGEKEAVMFIKGSNEHLSASEIDGRK